MGRVVYAANGSNGRQQRSHHELYPGSTAEFRFPQGWFHWLTAKPATTYVLQFPQIIDAEESDEDDGV